jgi:hypothetical protein
MTSEASQSLYISRIRGFLALKHPETCAEPYRPGLFGFGVPKPDSQSHRLQKSFPNLQAALRLKPPACGNCQTLPLLEAMLSLQWKLTSMTCCGNLLHQKCSQLKKVHLKNGCCTPYYTKFAAIANSVS